MIERITDFLSRGIWEVKLATLPSVKRFCLRYLRVLMLAVRGFLRNDSQKTAAVLTYYSVLNVVPLVAVAFAVAKGFGLGKLMEKEIVEMAEQAQWQADLTNQILQFSRSLLQQAQGGIIAGLGVIILLWTVVSIMGKIEDSFNTVWEVRKPRTLVRKFSDYFSMMALAPVLLVVSASVTVLVSSRLKEIVKAYSVLGGLTDVVFLLLGLLPYVSMWVLLSVLYVVMPNRKVPVRSCLLGGIAAGTLLQVVQWAYIKFQIGASGYGVIYGSFAALPLFLGWLQTSWMIVLFGSELAYADRHHETFGFHPDYDRLTPWEKRSWRIRIVSLLVKRFVEGAKPAGTEEISTLLEIPLRLTSRLLQDLTDAGLAVEVAGKGDGGIAVAYQPAKSPEELKIMDVIEACEGRAGESRKDSNEISLYLRELAEEGKKSKANAKIKDISSGSSEIEPGQTRK